LRLRHEHGWNEKGEYQKMAFHWNTGAF